MRYERYIRCTYRFYLCPLYNELRLCAFYLLSANYVHQNKMIGLALYSEDYDREMEILRLSGYFISIPYCLVNPKWMVMKQIQNKVIFL